MPSYMRVALGALTTLVVIGVASASTGRGDFTGAFAFAGFDRSVDLALSGSAPTTPLDGEPSSLAVAPDGSVYFSTGSLYRVSRAGWMTTVGGFKRNAPGEVAVARDGSLYVFDDAHHELVKVRGNRRTVVAGSRADCDSTLDSNPATAIPLCYVTALDVDSQGRVLIATDWSGVDRIRRLNADGTIETVAGGGTGDGSSGPATAARLDDPEDIAALPGGGFLIADSGRRRVFDVSAKGDIRVVAGGHSGPRGTARSLRLSPVSVAPLPGGGFVTATGDRLVRVGANDRFSYLGGSPAEPVAGLGGALASTHFYARDVAVSRAGDLLVSTGQRVLLLPRPDSSQSAVAFMQASVRSAHRYVLQFNSRRAGTGYITPTGGRKHLKTIAVRAHPGVNTVRLPAGLGSAAYTFMLNLTRGRTEAGDVAAFLTGPGLTVKEAELLIDSDRKEVGDARVREGVDQYSRGKCRAMSATRADCQIELTPYLDSTYCDHTAAVALGPTGAVSIREYAGCKFAQRPKWRGRAHAAPALVPY